MLKEIQLACVRSDQAYHREAVVRTAVLEVGRVTSQHCEVSVSQAFPYFSNPVKQVDVLRSTPVGGTCGTRLGIRVPRARGS